MSLRGLISFFKQPFHVESKLKHDWRPCLVSGKPGRVCDSVFCNAQHVEVLSREEYYAYFGERFGMWPR
jgi:hypothetical protein